MISPSLPDSLLAHVGKVINTHLGLHFPESRREQLERGLKKAAADLGFERLDDYARWLTTTDLTPDQLQPLADHLTIGETYFFREAFSLNLLRNDILPTLIAQRANQTPVLRLWSAGCSTGEEPYSLAILLDRYFPQLNDWPISILATDINECFLKKARRAVYRKWSFRNTPKWVQERYFSYAPNADEYVLHQHIKRNVSFAWLNLVASGNPSFANNTHHMDVILCRNVLIYFNQKTINQIVDRFVQALNPNGWLIVGPSEAAFLTHPQLHPLTVGKGTVFQKGQSRPSRSIQIPRPESMPPVDVAPLPPPPPVERPAAPPSLPPSAPDILTQATDLLGQGQYQQAATLLQGALSKGGSASQKSAMLMLLAQVFANQGQLDHALQWIEQAIGVDKINPGSHYLRGTILQEQDRPIEAKKAFKRALFLDPNFVLAHFALGNLSRQSKRPGRANRHYRTAWQALKNRPATEILPASGGLTVFELTNILQSLL